MNNIKFITDNILSGKNIRESLCFNLSEANADVLRKKILAMGLDPTGKSVDEMEKVLAMAIWAQEHPGEEFPEEYEAILAQSKAVATKDWVNKNFKDTEWWIQQKMDGMRSIMTLNGDIIRMTSRNRSAKNYMLQPHEDKVLGFQDLKNPFKNGRTVLDGELMAPNKNIPTMSGSITTTQLQAVVAQTNMPQEDSFKIQQQYGSLYYVVYDILWFDGQDVQDLPFEEREPLYVAAVNEIKKANPDAPIEALSTTKVYDDPWEIFQQAIANDEEGLMFKKRDFKYQQGKRVAGLQKLKGERTYDAVAWDALPAKAGGRNENYIGGINFYATIDGEWRRVASVSSFSDGERKAMTDYDENGKPILKQEYVGKVGELKGNNVSRDGFLVHPRFLQWRNDRNKDNVVYTASDWQQVDR